MKSTEKIIEDSCLTRQQAANYLKICKATLDKLSIPKIKLNRRVLYRRVALDTWLQKQERAVLK